MAGQEGDRAVESERGVGRAAHAVGAPGGRTDGERDLFGFDADDGCRAPVFAAAQDEMRAERERGERRYCRCRFDRGFNCRRRREAAGSEQRNCGGGVVRRRLE